MTTAKKCLRCGNTLASSPVAALSAWLFRLPECQCEHFDALNTFHSLETPVEVSKFSDKVGTTLLGRYKVLSLLGEGGMGQVYRVRDILDNSDYAMKFIAPDHTDPVYMERRLENEALAAGSLSHKNIVALYKFGRMDDGSAYLVMEYVNGESIEQLLKVQKMLDSSIATDVFMQITLALMHAHERGIVHRDLKPANVLLTSLEAKYSVKLTDFGIAKFTNASNQTRLTQAGEIIGTPLFMSPEQCKGEPLDARSDIYSFGCIMYKVLSGTVPFVGENPVRIILKHISEPAPFLPVELGLNKNWNVLIQRCLAKEPSHRYQTCHELLDDLMRLRDQKSLSRSSHNIHISLVRNVSTVSTGLVLMVLILVGVNSKIWSSSNPFNSQHTKSASVSDIANFDARDRAHFIQKEKKESSDETLAVVDKSDLDGLGAVDLATANKDFAVFLSEHSNATSIEIDPDMADELASKRRNLFNKSISDSALEGFKNLYYVRKIQILGCRLITGRGMKYIIDNPYLHLVDINLNSTPVKDDTARALLSIRSLKSLGLENTKITDAAFSVHNESIQSLTLNRTSVGNRALSYLKKFSGLRSLAIAHTNVTDEGVEQLKSLPICGLWISDTAITDAVANSISTMKNLNTLSVSGTNVSRKFLKGLKSLNKLTSLEIRRCPNITPEDINAFQREHEHCVLISKPKVEAFDAH